MTGDAPAGRPGDAGAPAPPAGQADAPADAAVAKPAAGPAGARRGPRPPEIPEQYFSFSGRIVECHAEDDSAGAAYDEIFARARFDAAFPEAAALPMLIGLDLEWKPDRSGETALVKGHGRSWRREPRGEGEK